VERHVRRLTRTYQARRDALMEALDADVVRFDPPQSGSALWVEVDPDLDDEAWAWESRTGGVAFLTGRHFFFDKRPHASLWLSLAHLAEEDLRTAVRGMAEALARLKSRRPRGRRLALAPEWCGHAISSTSTFHQRDGIARQKSTAAPAAVCN
jgi:DNA-binding transcriptional MocR family regulator